jgi:hypothetical protein
MSICTGKRTPKRAGLFLALLLTAFINSGGNSVYAQTDKEEVIFRAMADELQRNRDSLRLDGQEAPFFIQYVVKKGVIFQAQATLGALTGVNEFPLGSIFVQTLVGNYQMSNLNHTSSDYFTGSSDTAPLDDDYEEIRRRLWLLTDDAYKRAIEAYSTKMAAVKRQNLPHDVLELPDFTPLPETIYRGEARAVNFEQTHWKQMAKDCSAVFASCPQIYGSNVGIEVYSGNIYSLNSEGIQMKHPVRMVAVAVNAYTKLPDGEEISDRLSYYGWYGNDLPAVELILDDITRMADRMTALTNAPAVEESYTGPVMLEGPVVASVMASGLLAQQTGLTAYRAPIRSGGVQRSMEDRINRKILSSDMVVKSVPHVQQYNGNRLIGAYETDAEGITPKELLLVENGMLRALLNDRVPKRKTQMPTGNRVYTYQPQSIGSWVSPGVLSIQSVQGFSRETLKQKLLDAAKDEGLEYAYIIRSLPNGRNDYLYKVQVSDGNEMLVHAGSVLDVGLSRLKRSLGASSDNEAVNMIVGNAPLSVIYPEAMVIEEVDIEKRNLQNTTKLPTVSNPLE